MTTAHFWCDGHFTNINACEVWGVRIGIQVSRKEFYKYTLRLNQCRILSKKRKKRKKEAVGKKKIKAFMIKEVGLDCQ